MGDSCEVRGGLSPRITAALDVSRSLAAGYVVLHHLANSRGWSHGLGLILRFGQEAVLVFFLLSGFVIFANERNRALAPRGYYLRRLRRIYPTLIIAMLVSTAIAIDNGNFIQRFNYASLIGTLLSVQDVGFLKPGVITDPYLDNIPLWSLSYEVAFYIAFPVVLRAWITEPKLTNIILGLICCGSYCLFVALPNHFALVVSYFLVWWCGAMAADAYLRGCADFRGFMPALTSLALLCLVAVVGVKVAGYRGAGFYPFLPLRHFSVGMLMLLALAGPIGARIAGWCLFLSRPASSVASISYGLYVLHYPILVDSGRAKSLPGLAAALLALITISYFADRWLNAKLPRAPHS